MPSTVSISVVFTDLVGSTETSARLGPAESEKLRLVHFHLLRTAIAASGGTEVKNLGDGLMVVFRSVSSAFEGAVLMQQQVEVHNRTAAESLGVRIGLSTGDAVEEDGDYFGDTVVEAARLCALADGGAILATEVAALVGRIPPDRYEPVGEVVLKGLPAAVRAVQVRWEPAPRTAPVPLPSRLEVAGGAERAVVGREAELEQLLRHRTRAAAGERGIVLVAGEPGVGKTTLVTQFARAAHDDGSVIVYGRCDEDLGVPYGPWVEAFGDLIERAPEGYVAEHFRESAPQLSRVLRGLERHLADADGGTSDPETDRYLLFQAVWATLGSLAEESPPLVVVLDDLHWADAPTLALLRHVVTASAHAPLMLVGTYRDTEVDRRHLLTDTLATLWRTPGCERIQLGGLDDAGMLALVEDRVGHEMDVDGIGLARALRRETAGNPFFTEELLRDLAESGGLVQGDDQRWRPADAFDSVRLPESVRDVIAQRVGRMGPDAHRVLSAASIIGRDFDLALLSQVLEEPEDDVLAVIETALAASVVEEVEGKVDRFTFTHALVQHTMSSELPVARQRRLHRRVAEAIEAVAGPDPGARVGELAGHWLAATAPVDSAKALHYARLAGERALSCLAPDDALRWFRTALDVVDPGDDGTRVGLLVSVGVAERQVGEPSYRATLLDAAALAQRLGDTPSLVAAALANNRGYHSSSGHIDTERVEVLEAALAAVGPDDGIERALLLATVCAELAFSAEPARLQALFDEALAIARRIGDPRTIVEVTSRTRVAVGFPETARQRVEIDRESRRLADELDDPALIFHAAQALLWASAEIGDRDTVDRELATMHAIAEETGQATLRWLATYSAAMRAAMGGDPVESECLATEALEIGAGSGQPDAATFYGGQLVRVREMQGRFDELLPLLEDLVAENPGLPVFRSVYAHACAESGRLEVAARLLDDALSEGFDAPHDMQWSTATVLWAMTAVRAGHRAVAEVLSPMLAPFDSQVAFTGLTDIGPFAHYLGELAVLLGDLEAAQRHFDTALELEGRTGDPYMTALTRLGRARLLLERSGPDDTAGALAELDRAVELADDHGYLLVLCDAQELSSRVERPGPQPAAT